MNRVKNFCILLLSLTIILTGCLNSTKQDEEKIFPNSISELNELQEKNKLNVTPVKGGTINITCNNATTFNPLFNKDQSVDYMLKLIYDPLIKFSEDEKPSAALAETWELNDTELVINLKQNVKWHDETNLTAQDVKYTIDQLKEAGSDSLYNICVENISYCKVINNSVVKIVFKQSFGAALYSLNFPIIKQGTEKNTQKPIGTGAFKFNNYTPMKEINLIKNDQYYNDLPYIDAVNVIITRNDEAKVSMFEQKQTDLLYTNDIDWGKYYDKDKIKLHEFVTNYYDFLGFNFNNPLCSDKVIRHAIAYGVNRKKLISDNLLGHAVLTDVPIHPYSWLNKETKVVYNYNPKKSSELLKQAGWGDSNDNGILDKNIDGILNELKFNILVDKDNELKINVANSIKADLKQIGIEIDLSLVTQEEYMNRLKSGDYQLFLGGWKLSPIVDLSFAFNSNMIKTGSNYINYNNVEMDNLLAAAFNSTDEEQLKKAYNSLITHIEQELPYYSLYFRTNAVVSLQNIKGDFNPNSHNIYQDINKVFIQKNN